MRIRGPWYTAVIALLLVGDLARAVAPRPLLVRPRLPRGARQPEAAAAMGVNVARTKVIAFTLTSALAGIAGMVYAFVDNTVNPPIFGLDNAFLLLFMVIVGGAGRHAGAVHRRGAALPAAVLALAAGRATTTRWCSACWWSRRSCSSRAA